MDVFTQQLAEYIEPLEAFALPGTLMDCFEYHRRREMRKAAAAFSDRELSWFLHMMNEFRGPADRKEDFDLLFDPVMYMEDHSAWTDLPGLTIDLPSLNTQVFDRAGANSVFRAIAENEVLRLAVLADTYPDKAIVGLTNMAIAAYVDQDAMITDRISAIRYLAINTSARLEDHWVADDALWLKAGIRRVNLPDVVAEQKYDILQRRASVFNTPVTQEDLVCYSEQEIKFLAFNPDRFLLFGKSMHLALCGLCQRQIARWIEYVRNAEERQIYVGSPRFPQA
jgi:hypothetical protein